MDWKSGVLVPGVQSSISLVAFMVNESHSKHLNFPLHGSWDQSPPCGAALSKALSFCFISESLGDFPIDPFGKGGNDAISQDYIPYEIYWCEIDFVISLLNVCNNYIFQWSFWACVPSQGQNIRTSLIKNLFVILWQKCPLGYDRLALSQARAKGPEF